MKSILLIGGIAVVALVVITVAVVLLVGSRLPVQHTSSRTILISKTPAEVYALIHDFSSAPKWRSDVQQVEMKTLPNGKVGFRETGSQGTTNYEVSEDVPDQRLVTRITDTNLGYSGSWTYTLTAEQGGTRVTITENGEVTNVFFRFMSRFVFGHTSTIDTYLANLSKRLG